MLGGVADGAFLHFRGAGRDADHHAQARGEERTLVVDHLDEFADHLLRGVEIGDDAVLERADSLDILVLLALHGLGLGADGRAFAGEFVDGYDGGFVDDLLVVHENDGVGRSQVDGEFLL